MTSNTDVTIIIVHYNAASFLAECLRSIIATIDLDRVEILVCDNASPNDDWRSAIPEHDAVTLLELPENRGFGAANNVAARRAKGQYLFFLNPDVVLREDPLPHLRRVFTEHEDAGAVGPRLLNNDGSLQPSRGTFPHLLLSMAQLLKLKRLLPRDERLIPLVGTVMGRMFAQWYPPERLQRVDYITGAALMMPRTLFETLGGFDEVFFLYFEEIDLCRRLRTAGYHIYYVPSIGLVHHVDTARTSDPGFKEREALKSLLHYYRKHASPWDCTVLILFLRLLIATRLLVTRVQASLTSRDGRGPIAQKLTNLARMKKIIKDNGPRHPA